MDIGRRELLAGATSLGLATMVRSPGAITVRAEYLIAEAPRWHPLTRSLLDRANRAGQQLDRSRVERLIHELAGEHGRPVIKWMDAPGRAFEYLLRYPLDELAQMPTAQFWSYPPTISAASEDDQERSVGLYLHATRVLKVEEHGRALLAPQLFHKAQAIASQPLPEQVLEARAVAAEIGWIETSLPGAAAGAIRAVEDLLSVGCAKGSMQIYHQLMVFEAFECGLLATWETPDELGRNQSSSRRCPF
ncbi:hypothetical protein [Bradyrhizobium sp.]|jgi:hypothetical protein|uniref:hypothetical protein n=1 Tax=Bradyrhizobium sp. TaxID=376 RepID=UPI003C199813